MNQNLTLDLDDDRARPYFLWSEEMDLKTLKGILAGEQGEYLRASSRELEPEKA